MTIVSTFLKDDKRKPIELRVRLFDATVCEGQRTRNYEVKKHFSPEKFIILPVRKVINVERGAA